MKKKSLLFLLLALSVTGVSIAANIPAYIDPTSGPELWTTEVYNNSGGTLDVGDVVVWDTQNSTGDNDNYVTTTTTANYTGLIAGVVWPSDIAVGVNGSVVVRGPIAIDVVVSQAAAVDGYVCTSTTAGSGRDCASGSNDTDYARVLTAPASGATSVQAYVNTVK